MENDFDINLDQYPTLAIVEEIPDDKLTPGQRKIKEALTDARPRPWDNTSPWPPAGTH